MKSGHKKLKPKELIPILIVIGILAVLVVLRIYQCPLDLIFGIPCPMCGITRAYLSLLQGDIGMAFYYHPLWPVILVVGILYVLHLLGLIEPSKKIKDAVGYSLCFLLIACFVIRHIQGSPVVRIHFETSLIGKALDIIKQVFSFS